MSRALLALFFFTLAFAGAFGQQPALSPVEAKKDSYDELLARLKGGDTKIDYKAFRIAYSETKGASPYGSDREGRRLMNVAVIDKRYDDAIKLADEILKTTYLATDAHVAASISYRALGDTQRADFHKSIYLGLINSVLAGGDGKTPNTAFVVVSVEEEYAVMKALGCTVWGQTLGTQGGHRFDVLSGTEESTKSPVKIYFNIDIVWALQTKMLGPKP